MPISCLNTLESSKLNIENVVPLYESEQHSIYWLGGHHDDEEIACNTYLLVDEGEGYIFEPGGLSHFKSNFDKVSSVIPAFDITHILLSHQDPDVCASLPSWLQFNPDIKVVCSHLWQRFMPHYMVYHIDYLSMSDQGLSIPLKSGGSLECISTPYLHSPGSMTVFDSTSGFLFTGDIGAASIADDEPFHLHIPDWSQHIQNMQGFHQRYMSSTRAAAAFTQQVSKLPLTAILPQHGAIFRGDETRKFLEWFEVLPCGVDYLNPQ